VTFSKLSGLYLYTGIGYGASRCLTNSRSVNSACAEMSYSSGVRAVIMERDRMQLRDAE